MSRKSRRTPPSKADIAIDDSVIADCGILLESENGRKAKRLKTSDDNNSVEGKRLTLEKSGCQSSRNDYKATQQQQQLAEKSSTELLERSPGTTNTSSSERRTTGRAAIKASSPVEFAAVSDTVKQLVQKHLKNKDYPGLTEQQLQALYQLQWNTRIEGGFPDERESSNGGGALCRFFSRYSHGVESLAFTADSLWLAAGRTDGQIDIYDVKGRVLQIVRG